ncbi:MAG: NAD-dependent epimerase/dehydratase family protein [Promethearchaeota archaeon]
MTKILITGATGFIGSWLVRDLIKRGNNVIAHGSSKESIEILKQKLENENLISENIEFWEQDFLMKKWKFPDFSQIKNIIHCAAATKVREGTIENYDKYFSLNVQATKNIAKKALENGIFHFIHLSTGQIFGIPDTFPITENTPKNPINLYGITKLIGEYVVKSLGILGLNYTIVRPFSIYGEGHYNIISIIMDKIFRNDTLTIYGDGTQTRAFLHVNDICRAIGLILNNKTCFREEYNLSGPKEYSINELVELISNILNKKPKIGYKKSNVREIKRNVADLSKIKKLGFTPKETLEDFINQIN